MSGDGDGDAASAASTAYVLSLDVGTSTVCAYVYDNSAVVRGTGSRKVRLVRG